MELPKPDMYVREDIPARAGPLLTPMWGATKLDQHAAAEVAEERERIRTILRREHERSKHMHNYFAWIERQLFDGI